MFLSIITINRNNATGLKKTIDSVASQSCRDFEHIIIDGASSDNSVEIIEGYKASPAGKNLSYWVSEPDSGIYNAMNKGIQKAKGDYVAILNSGDWYVENIVEKIKDFSVNGVGKIIYGAVALYDGNEFKGVSGRAAECIPVGMIAHQSAFVPKHLHDIYGLYDEKLKIFSDYDLFCKFYLEKVPFVFSNLIIANYDINGISNYVTRKSVEELRSIKKKYGFYQKPTLLQRIIILVKIVLKWKDM